MQVVPFYDLLDNYQIPGMSRNKPGMSKYKYIRSTVCTIMYTKFVSKMSGHHSRYRDNHKNQVYHAGCQVIA